MRVSRPPGLSVSWDFCDDAPLFLLTVSVTGEATHSEDDLVLATALSGHASFLATRDGQLLKLASYGGLQFVPPGRLLAILDSERSMEPV